MCIAIEFRMITIKQNDRSSECATYVPNKCTCPWYVCERIQHVAGKPTRSSCVGGETLSHFQPRPTLKTMASLIKDCRAAVSRLAPGMLFKKLPLFFNVHSFKMFGKCLTFRTSKWFHGHGSSLVTHWFLFFIKLSALWPASGALASLASSKSFHAEPGSATLCAIRIH